MADIKGYDKWKLDSGQEDEVVYCNCDHCGREIYFGDEIFYMPNSEVVHNDCLYDYTLDVIVEKSTWAGMS